MATPSSPAGRVAAFLRRLTGFLGLISAATLFTLGVLLLWPLKGWTVAVPIGSRWSGRIVAAEIGDRVELRIVPAGPREGSRAGRAAAAIRNGDIRWRAYVLLRQAQPQLSVADAGPEELSSGVVAAPVWETASYGFLSECGPNDARRLLVGALLNQDQFVAAHTLLVQSTCAPGATPGAVADTFDLSAITYDHLRLGLPATYSVHPAGGSTDSQSFVRDTDGAATADPSQMRSLFNLWSFRLGTPVGSVGRAALGSAICAVSLAWLILMLRRPVVRRWRIARNLCPICGYDVRGSSDTCSECGASRSR